MFGSTVKTCGSFIGMSFQISCFVISNRNVIYFFSNMFMKNGVTAECITFAGCIRQRYLFVLNYSSVFCDIIFSILQFFEVVRRNPVCYCFFPIYLSASFLFTNNKAV